MYKQYIILRKDAKTVNDKMVSAQKLAVMTAHASMSFLTNLIRKNQKEVDGKILISFYLEKDINENWFQGAFTKVLLEAKGLNGMQKAYHLALENGFKEGKDFFLIKDNCYTELIPDPGESTCFIGIGFYPMDETNEKLKNITKKFQLYK